MPVYLFTFHAYRSWMPDHPRGFTQKAKGYQHPNGALARAYRGVAKYPEFSFDYDTQRFLLETAQEVCARRAWTLHAGACEFTHLHLLVSWRDEARWEDVRGKLRNVMSLMLSMQNGVRGRPWFVEGASRKRVVEQMHFDHLIRTYLPSHSGWRWDAERGWRTPRKKTRERSTGP